MFLWFDSTLCSNNQIDMDISKSKFVKNLVFRATKKASYGDEQRSISYQAWLRLPNNYRLSIITGPVGTGLTSVPNVYEIGFFSTHHGEMIKAHKEEYIFNTNGVEKEVVDYDTVAGYLTLEGLEEYIVEISERPARTISMEIAEGYIGV
jgi:hypothetical protein